MNVKNILNKAVRVAKRALVVVGLGVAAAMATAPQAHATNSWDTMFTDASTAITALGTSAGTLIGLVFTAIILLFVGFKLVKRASNKV